ncbi:MAG: arylesterase [Elusimicrobia bacterium]|nr:arylesterase [Elusimicrobiota bacterium]
MRRFLLSFFFFLVGGSLSLASSKTIVFFGDSLTAGHGLDEEKSYPAQIQRWMVQDGIQWKVVNAGVSGDTTAGGLRRIHWILRSNPSLVFVALGGNDGLRGIPLKNTRKNLDNILLGLKRSGVKVILAGMQLPKNYGEKYREEFSRIYPELAKKHQIVLFPFLLEEVAMVPELNLSDGIHPNANGHARIAKNVYQFIQPLLKK